MRAGRPDGVADGVAFVAAEVVHHNDVARSEGWTQDALDVSAEDVAVHRAVEDPRRVDPVMAQRGDEGGRSSGQTGPRQAGDPLSAPSLGAGPYWSSPMSHQ
ncbi:hypothetical protein IMCC21224_1725 [Puniceibacterium sp. IMCC21224]|nr:hypothetical protein IMCC21224_1725 [Puniceibacterium sp. IMCC21224]